MHSLIEGRIRETNGTTYLVHLENRTCGCRTFQDQDSPCSHAIAAIYATHQAIDFMPIYLRRATYIEMYEQNLPPVVHVVKLGIMHAVVGVLTSN